MIFKYNIEDHLQTLPPECKFITDEIMHSTWQNAYENGLLPDNKYEEDYDYEIVCIMRKKENNNEQQN